MRESRGRGRLVLVLGATIATATAVLDAVLGGDTILIGALVAAPLVAATAAGVKGTTWMAVYATALAVVLGIPDEFFGSGDHLVRILTVVVGSALAVWVARLRHDRERESGQLALLYEVAQVLADYDAMGAATRRLLKTIGDGLQWQVGALWELRGGRLRCCEVWCADGVDPGAFADLSRQFVLRPGVGLPGAVWASGRPEWIPDVRNDETFPRAEQAAEAGLRTGVGFPLKAGNRVLGVMEFFSHDAQEPDDELVRLLSLFGARIGNFMEAARAEAALRESEARKAAMLDSALDCVITMDHLGRIVEFNPAAERTFGYSAAEVVGREMAALVIPPHLRDAHRAALSRYLETGESKILGKRLELSAMRSGGEEFPVELTITRISQEDPPMFTGYVRDIAERREAEDQRAELLQLEQVARVDATRAREQLEAILRGVADGITAQAPDGSLLFANDAAVAVLGFKSREELLGAPLSEVMSRFDVLDEQGRPYPVEDLPGRRALAGEEAPEAVVRFRVVATGEERWSVVKSTPIRDDEGNVVMAINVFEDVTAVKRSEREHAFLAESSRILSSSLDPDETLRRVATFAVPDIADWCAVDVKGPGGSIERVALAHADPAQVKRAEEIQREYPPDPKAPTGVPRVLATGEPELYPRIPDELLEQAAVNERHLELIRDFGLRSAMLVPMEVRGETVGAMTFASGPSGRHFDDQDLELAQDVARRCATALENSRLYAERAYIAQTLQQSLLPAELPHIPGLQAAARFHATGEGTDVGGDFYDLFETGRRGWTVVVGDVCGKGPDAAVVTALARYTLRTAAMQEGLPSRSLEVLNRALLRQRGDRRFCTVAYAYVEPVADGAKVGFASGGHPLPIVLREDGEVEFLGEHGTLLGVVPDPSFEDRSTRLHPGDALIFYTDGVTEARGENGFLGEDQLAELIRSCAGASADDIAAKVERTALEHQEGDPRDDIAVVVLRADR